VQRSLPAHRILMLSRERGCEPQYAPIFETFPVNPNAFQTATLLRVTDPVVFGAQDACGNLPLSLRGTSEERGEINKKRLLSPALSSFIEEERERKCGCALKAKLFPNTNGHRPAVRLPRFRPRWSYPTHVPPVWVVAKKTADKKTCTKLK